MLIAFARREQGIVLAQGNSPGLQSVRDLARKNVRVAVRPSGAGAQLLLEFLLRREGLDVSALSIIAPICPAGPDIAQAVRTGRADCGISIRDVANAAGLFFVSLIWERFDLVVRQPELHKSRCKHCCHS